MRAGIQGAARPRAEGFTLVELITVIALLGILAVVAGPRFFAADDFNSAFFFDDTLAAVRYAQKLSIATGCNVQVSFTANSYTLNLQDGPTSADGCDGAGYAQAVIHPGTRAATYVGTAPGGVSVGSSVSPLLFDPLGRAMDATEIMTDSTITVGGRTINVVGETGLVYAP